MAESLKVLMMGGPRSGKTSALAGLVDTMVNGEVKNLINVRDVSDSSLVKQKLAQKIENLKLTMIQSLGKTIIVDDSKTDTYQHFTVEFAIPGTDNSMNICFTDVNGEFFESGRSHAAEISEKVKESDIFIIAVDTPSLMEAVNPANPLMNEAINKAVNNVNDIHNLITYIDDKDGSDAKLVLFVPLKCEKWAHENVLDKVSDRIEQVYSTPICALSRMNNVEVDIIPIQTVGNIEFAEHLKSYLCISDGGSPVRCSLIRNGSMVRYCNGLERRTVKESDRFVLDPQSPIKEGSSILRPNSWFRVISKEYAPHNCEQLAYYILRFVLSKYLFVKEIEKKNEEEQKDRKELNRVLTAVIIGIVNVPAAIGYYFMDKMIDYFGTVSYDQLHDFIQSINERNLLKTSGEGIRCIKQSILQQ